MNIKKQLIAYTMGVLILVCTITFFISKFLPYNYKTEINNYSNLYNLPTNLICAVINAESHFNKKAISSAGAVGLMQLMPTTAKQLADELNLKNIDLYAPNTNINLGCYYLSKLILKYKNINTALCAYNAGPKNVDVWLINKKHSKDMLVIDYIPFKETRNYIRKINIFRTFYTNVYNL